MAAKSITTIAGVAKALKVDERTVKAWLAQDCPGKRGKYSLDEIKAWRAANKAPDPKLRRQDAATYQQRRQSAEIRKIEADASARELKTQMLRGELVRVVDVLQTIAQRDLRIKTRLEALPDELQMTFPKEVRAAATARFSDAIRLLLKELSEWPCFEIPNGDVHDPDPE